MKYILEYDIYHDIQNLNNLFIELDFNYNDILEFLKEECNFDDHDIKIFFLLNEGEKWEKFKDGMSNLKDKFVNTKDKVKNAWWKTKEVAGRVKDHIARNKYKYAAGAILATGALGLAAAPFALGAGHLADRYPN